MSDWPEYVVDASVAAKWMLSDEEDVDHAHRVLDDFTNDRIRLYAPEQLIAELGSTLSVASSVRRGRIDKTAARDKLAAFLTLGIVTTPSSSLVISAFDLAGQLNCSAYDALYLALAQRLSVPLINADQRLHERLGHLPGVLWLSDYVSEPEPPHH
jgi:predicted nucleic acid-binding protein